MSQELFEKKLHGVMDELDVILKESNDQQKKQISRLAVDILRITLSE